MPKNVRFWRNVTLIGLAHVVAIVAIVRWSRESDTQNGQSVVWMNGNAGDGIAAPVKKAIPLPKPMKISTPPPAPLRKEEPPDEDNSTLTSSKSEIQLGTPTPTPRSTSTPKPTPVVRATPKLTPKSSPKPTPKATPKKIILAKATPKPSPKIKPTPSPIEPAETVIPKASVAPQPFNSPEELPKPVVPNTGAGKGTSAGAGGHAGGSGGESQFGWYGSMLHDRFYSEWVQPTASVPSNVKLAVLVKLRIEKDGRVSKFEIMKPSNNPIVDESVAAVAKRVTQVDPLPTGLVKGEHYDVRINFELNSEQ
jgi:TonB family protein